MRDKVSIARVKALHPKVRAEVAKLIDEVEKRFSPYIAVRIVQGYRTFAEQSALYAQGRTKRGSRVTNAKAGQSYHNYGLAFDFALLYDRDKNGTFETLSWDTHLDYDVDRLRDWLEVVAVFKAFGWAWGGLWKSIKDDPHLEKLFGYNWKTLLARHNTGKVDKEGYVII